jgi:hypothetical protein
MVNLIPGLASYFPSEDATQAQFNFEYSIESSQVGIKCLDLSLMLWQK